MAWERASAWSVGRTSFGMPSVEAPATRRTMVADAGRAQRRVRSPERRELLDRIARRRRDRLRTRNVELRRDLRHRLRHYLRRRRRRWSASMLGREWLLGASANGRRHGASVQGRVPSRYDFFAHTPTCPKLK